MHEGVNAFLSVFVTLCPSVYLFPGCVSVSLFLCLSECKATDVSLSVKQLIVLLSTAMRRGGRRIKYGKRSLVCRLRRMKLSGTCKGAGQK